MNVIRDAFLKRYQGRAWRFDFPFHSFKATKECFNDLRLVPYPALYLEDTKHSKKLGILPSKTEAIVMDCECVNDIMYVKLLVLSNEVIQSLDTHEIYIEVPMIKWFEECLERSEEL